MRRALRDRFDLLLERAIHALPDRIRAVIDEVPVVVMDRPDKHLVNQLRAAGLIQPSSAEPETTSGTSVGDTAVPSARNAESDADRSDDDDAGEVMGLHSGVAITEQSITDSGQLPAQIHVFRDATVDFAGGWDQPDADHVIYEEIRVTLLHEIGHHFGLDEDDLDRLGYA